MLPLRDLRVDARLNKAEAPEAEVEEARPGEDFMIGWGPSPADPSMCIRMFPLTTAASARSSRMPLPHTKHVAMNFVTFMQASTYRMAGAALLGTLLYKVKIVWNFSGISTISGLIAGVLCILVGSLVVGDVGEDIICCICCWLNCYVYRVYDC